MSARSSDTARFTSVLLAESRSELLKAVRLPAFILPVLLFPALFYTLFGLLLGGSVMGSGWNPARHLLGSYATFGVVGAALFGLGVGVAAERGQGWLLLKRATPMPPLAYFAAKAVMSVLIGIMITALLGTLAVAFGGVQLTVGSWGTLLVTLGLGAIPFCAFGCVLGYVTGPTSAPAIANLIYLPMSFASGLWVPLPALPDALQRAAPLLPPYHLAELAHRAIGTGTAGALPHVAALAGFTALSLAAAVFCYRRDSDRTWG